MTILTRLAQAVRWHRRGLAAIAAGLCVLAVIAALSPDAAPTQLVVRARVALHAGHTVSDADLVVQPVAVGALPDGALTNTTTLVGRVLVGDVPRGQVLTADDVVTTSDPPPGFAFVPIRVKDAGVAALLHVGDQVTLVAADADGQPVVLAQSARVSALPRDQGGSGPETSGFLVVVSVPTSQAARLTAWAANTPLGVMFA